MCFFFLSDCFLSFVFCLFFSLSKMSSQRKGVRSLETATESRRKRELATVAIRKQKREEQLLKRRHLACMSPAQASPVTGGNNTDPLTAIVQMFKIAETPQDLVSAHEALVCGFSFKVPFLGGMTSFIVSNTQNRVLPEAVKSLSSPDRAVQLRALVFLRQLLSIGLHTPCFPLHQCDALDK